MTDMGYQGRTPRQEEQMFQIGNSVGLLFIGAIALVGLYGLVTLFL